MCKIAGVKAVCRYLSGESGANLVVAETYGLAGVGDDQSFRDLTRQTHAPGPVRTTVFRGRKVRVADHPPRIASRVSFKPGPQGTRLLP